MMSTAWWAIHFVFTAEHAWGFNCDIAWTDVMQIDLRVTDGWFVKLQHDNNYYTIDGGKVNEGFSPISVID